MQAVYWLDQALDSPTARLETGSLCASTDTSALSARIFRLPSHKKP